MTQTERYVGEIEGSGKGRAFKVTEKYEEKTVPDSAGGSLIFVEPVNSFFRNRNASTYYPERKGVQETINGEDPNVYEMASFPRGVMVIFNMCKFDVSSGLQDYPRAGSDVDATAMKDIFIEFGFVVCVYENACKKEIFEVTTELSIRYSNSSCFACTVLSHGEEDYFYARDQRVNYREFFSILESPYWVGKPKLYFLQACLGAKHMDSLQLDGVDEVDGPSNIAKDSLIPLPRQSDFFYAYSTVPGYTSWRNTLHGSWFIQEICTAFRKHSHELDFSRIMTRANAAIASRMTVTDKDKTNDKRQVASFVSQLRKDLFFFNNDLTCAKVKYPSVETDFS